MYNKYLDENKSVFSEIYTTVDREEEKKEPLFAPLEKRKPAFSLQRLLSVVDIEKIGLLPIVLLLLLLVDVDDDEKLIIIALAVIFGI